jgi:hypothetical protein
LHLCLCIGPAADGALKHSAEQAMGEEIAEQASGNAGLNSAQRLSQRRAIA